MKSEKGMAMVTIIIIAVLSIVVITGGVYVAIKIQNGEIQIGDSKTDDTETEKQGDYTVDELLDLYSKSVENGDYQMFKKTLPKTIKKETLDMLYSEDFDELFEDYCDDLKDEYGKGYKITFNVTGQKEEPQEWLDRNGAYMGLKITKCYELQGTMTISGPKKTNTMNLKEVWYAEVEGEWGLIVE